ncbi:MAG TPA: pantoate--beta-alanine ligase [Candidatus Sumerlaeota bacterium]|nr:pantoate--beta-alanine ligase [Candidatus Sumerlaeota bacterium]HRR29771.1 pantoate--beta-alanine ligase [Candidatus Sumerlaeia bacterium]HON50208.1 pantoate--beta-alanine ligase [Candidatus Sumerlaeota bacterium]HOR63424.1 pantoate--beta-alanine ligase [Candidatus Sumerlaeota bacterium]HPL74175.1 pantoate--beta-alanine ligase [Candidatus Sumerlaeota bacterium]
MKIIKKPKEMQKAALAEKKKGRRIALVPTMGFFHEGHLSLMREARRRADILVVSNFVNPTQFGPKEDLARYPRDFKRDCKLAEQIPVDIMFAPRNEDMYPTSFRTFVEVEGWGKVLCGMTRPTHFRGVTTIVLKLFNIVQPDVAVFGWKDAQQFLILRRMVEDLNLPVEMVGGEIVREKNGLAMSSRNKYLTNEEFEDASVINKTLKKAFVLIKEGADIDAVRHFIIKSISQTKYGKLDYVDFVSRSTLEPLEQIKKGDTLIALAVFFGKTRLIDNLRV